MKRKQMNRSRVFLCSFLAALALAQGCADKPKPTPAPPPPPAPPPNPLTASELPSCAAADGTVYRVGRKAELYWLVGGRAYEVSLRFQQPKASANAPDSMPAEEADSIRYREPDWPYNIKKGVLFADARGGVYAVGGERLWYVQAGKANAVDVAPASELPSSAPAVTRASVLWSVISAYGKAAYQAGDEAGYEAGYEAGQEAAFEYVRDEARR